MVFPEGEIAKAKIALKGFFRIDIAVTLDGTLAQQ
jgi:hypothetical protein